MIWHSCIRPSHSFFLRLMHRKLLTDENLRPQICTLDSIYVLCYPSDETSTHLFLSCDFAPNLWQWLGVRLNCDINLSSIAAILDYIFVCCSS